VWGKPAKRIFLLWLRTNNLQQKFLKNSYSPVLVFSGIVLPSKSAPSLAVLYGPARPFAGCSQYGRAWLLLYGPSTRPLLEQLYSPARCLSGCCCTALVAACSCCWVRPETRPLPSNAQPSSLGLFPCCQAPTLPRPKSPSALLSSSVSSLFSSAYFYLFILIYFPLS
jgi:hypothetical protein